MAADASTAAMCTYLIEARKYGAPTPDLPVSRDGKPKPAPPWIAAALYIVASNPALHPLTARRGVRGALGVVRVTKYGVPQVLVSRWHRPLTRSSQFLLASRLTPVPAPSWPK